MILTEADALTKACAQDPHYTLCKASHCMAWRYADPPAKTPVADTTKPVPWHDGKLRGYCGLAQKP